MKTTIISVTNSAESGNTTRCHFLMFSRPWPTSSPQLGVGAGSPNPRKSSATSEVIEATSAKGAKLMIGVSEFGRMWRKMIEAC